MSTRKPIELFSIAACLLLVGCQTAASTPRNAAEGQIPSITPLPTTSPAPTLLSTPTSPPTQTPTATPTPLPTLDYLPPQAALNSEGPWLIFDSIFEGRGDEWPSPHLWAMNADGTGAGFLANTVDLFYQVNLYDRIIVYVDFNWQERTVPVLKMLRLPEGTETDIIRLTTEEIFVKLDEASQVYTLRSAYVGGGLAWSPDGTKLAFVGALDEVSVDVYVLDFTTNEVNRIARLGVPGPGIVPRPTDLRWSPDGQYVLFSTFDQINMGYPMNPDGWYAAHIKNGSVSYVGIPDTNPAEVFPPDLRWWGTGHIALLSGFVPGVPNFEDGVHHIGTFDLETSEYTDIYIGTHRSYAVSYEHDIWLIAETHHPPSMTWIVDDVITELPNPQKISDVWWLEDEGVFKGCSTYPQEKCYTITLNGEIFEREPSPGSVYYESPNKTMVALVTNTSHDDDYRTTGLWIGDSKDTLREIYSQDHIRRGDPQYLSIPIATWSPDSQYFIMITNRGVYVAKAPDFELVNIGSYDFGNVRSVRWID